MSEQVQRGRSRRDRTTESVTSVDTPVVDTSDVVAGAECCLADIDEALDTCCVTEQDPQAALLEAVEALRESSKPRPYAEWSDDERLEAGDPIDWSRAKFEQVLGRTPSLIDRRDFQAYFNLSYQQVTGLSNQRDCGCGC